MRRFGLSTLIALTLVCGAQGQNVDANQLKNLTYYVPPIVQTFAASCGIANNKGQPLAVIYAYAVSTATYTCNLKGSNAGMLRVAAGATATFNGQIDVPAGIQIFDATTNSNAHILLPTPKGDVWANWFGVSSTNTDNQPAYTKAIEALANGSASVAGIKLRTTSGTFNLNSTVVFTSMMGFTFEGAGHGTIFTWGGNNSSPMFSVQRAFYSNFRGFKILGNATNQLLYGIQSINSATGSTGTGTKYSDIFMEGVAGYITTGMYWGVGTDANNDQALVERVQVFNYSHSGFTVANTQVVDLVFFKCTALSDGYGSYGVEALQGTFQWLYGGMAGNYTSDFRISNTGKGNTVILGGSYEASSKFITTGGPAYTYSGLVATQFNWSGECVGDSQADIQALLLHGTTCPAAGGSFFDYKYVGTLTVSDFSAGIGLLTFGKTAAYTMNLTNFGAGFPSVGTEVRKGVLFANTNNTIATIFNVGKPLDVSISTNIDGGVTYLPLELHPIVTPITASNWTWAVNTAVQAATANVAISQTTTANTSATTVTSFGTPSFPGQRLDVYCNDTNTTWQRGSGPGLIAFEGGSATSAATAGKMYTFISYLTQWILTNK